MSQFLTAVSNGHLNVLVNDHDSVVTVFGQHDRVVCFQPQGNELYMRVDLKWDLGMPTEAQMLTVARKDQDVRGRWKLDRTVPWTHGGNECVDVFFIRA